MLGPAGTAGVQDQQHLPRLTPHQGGEEGEGAVENGEVPRQDRHDRVQPGKCWGWGRYLAGAGGVPAASAVFPPAAAGATPREEQRNWTQVPQARVPSTAGG